VKKRLLFIKVFFTLLGTFAVLNAFCFFYANPTVHYPTSSHATDYAWEPNTFYSGGTEGFATGRTDELGYINIQPAQTGQALDGIVMGSSHMEAKNINMDSNVVAQLNHRYKGNYFFYNIGTSGHDFLRCVRNARDALAAFQPRRYLIIETDRIELDYDSINAVIDGTYPYLESHSDGIIGFLQHFPLLRRLYWQWENTSGLLKEPTGGGILDNGPNPGNQVTSDKYASTISDIFDFLVASTGNTDVIIFFHPGIEFDSDGNMIPVVDPDKLHDFKRLCDEHGITFIDMTDDFIAAYDKERIVPYGFANTIPGQGHLNKYGHKMIAERLYRTIEAIEQTKGK
jgi:hypothetical protein